MQAFKKSMQKRGQDIDCGLTHSETKDSLRQKKYVVYGALIWITLTFYLFYSLISMRYENGGQCVSFILSSEKLRNPCLEYFYYVVKAFSSNPYPHTYTKLYILKKKCKYA